MKTTGSVLLGMSGGVDSSVAAKLLIDSGWQVTGATLKFFDNADIPGGAQRSCCSLEDVEDARNVAWKLGFDHYVFNSREDFRREVMERFSKTYFSGGTPNPCVDCNRRVRFDQLLHRADVLGIDAIATGHYAGIRWDEQTGRYLLIRPKDSWKDQTYMLYGLSQNILSRTVFPLFSYEKPEIRKIAEENQLLNARKRDSQDICFVPDGDYAAFLEMFSGISINPGNYIDRENHILGMHQGAVRYTIGQRKGLGIAMGRPVFVTGKNMERNEVILGEEKQLYANSVIASDANWIAFKQLDATRKVTAKIRYRQKEVSAEISPLENNCFSVRFDTPQRAAAVGQAVVIYDKELVLGGGTITQVEPAD